MVGRHKGLKQINGRSWMERKTDPVQINLLDGLHAAGFQPLVFDEHTTKAEFAAYLNEIGWNHDKA
jgi:hypothetical protein